MEHLLTDRRQEGGQCVWNETILSNFKSITEFRNKLLVNFFYL
jgi:hypothetical protein